MARIFKRLGIDYAILGREEQSDGDSQRLAGEKGLFEMLAEKNIAAFEKYEFDEIVVTGPHAYNAILNEYPKVNGKSEFKVRHYTQMLMDHIDKIKSLFTREIPTKITFHDPCYLGRHNGEYDAPRELLKVIPGVELVEMGRCKENGYCCGGGGGGQWIDLTELMPERMSDRRAREAVETGSTILAVTCPYEVSRFEDGVKSTGNEGKLVVRDIAELLDYAMGGDSPNPILFSEM
jgi:Fe-S oxidoreductase